MRTASKLLTLFSALLFLSASTAQAQNSSEVSIGIRRAVASRVLGETRTIYIYLPESYQESRGYRRYPVLYLRDGGKFFHSFTGAVQQLTSDATPHAPEMIVVAIVETDRVRDSSPTHSLKGFTGKEEEGYKTSGGGARFLSFLEQELIPYIDKEFSTSSYRMYCAYSFTGLSAIDELLDESTGFDAFLIIDPSWWWDDYALEKRARVALARRKFERVQLFMAANSESYPKKYFIESRDISLLAGILQNTNPAGLEWKFERYTDESHHSMPLRALYDGLSYFFRGYKPSLNELYLEPAQLKSRYEALSRRLGERVSLSEGLLSFFGYQFLQGFKEPDQAIIYFEMMADAYPGSWAAWHGLGEAYNTKGDRAKAASMYEKSLTLNPKNEDARKMLQGLRGQ